jgi:putative endonuclease
MHPKDALGRQGEQLAAEYLQKAGFRILDPDYRCDELWVDIVGVLRSPSGDFTIEHLRGVG